MVDTDSEVIRAIVELGDEQGWQSIKEMALPYLAAGWQIGQIEDALGVPRAMIKQWLRDPDYRDAMLKLRTRHLDLLWQGIQGLTTKVLGNIRDALESEDEKLRWDATKWAAGALGVKDQLQQTTVVQIEGQITEETLKAFLLPALRAELGDDEGKMGRKVLVEKAVKVEDTIEGEFDELEDDWD